MPATPPRDATRQRLLDAATTLFRERGFESVSVREISQVAEANVAAVSYWFQGKEGLYAEVVRLAHERVGGMAEMPRLADTPEDPEGALRAWLAWNLKRLIDPSHDSTLSDLIHLELRAPSPMFLDIVNQHMQPAMQELSLQISAVTGIPLEHPSLRTLSIAVMGQSVIFRLARPAALALGGLAAAPSEEEVATMVTLLSELCLGGLHGLRHPQENS